MSDEIKKELDEVLALLKELKGRRRSDNTHQEEHEYLRQIIEEHKARKEFWQSIRTRTIGAGIWSFIVIMATACLFTLKSWLSGNF